MTFSQRYYRSPRTHLGVVLERLQQEYATTTRQTSSFEEVCNMASIPRDLRKALLATLVDAGYATDEGHGLVRLTALGSETAATPPAGEETATAEDRRLYRSMPENNAPPRIPGARPGGWRS